MQPGTATPTGTQRGNWWCERVGPRVSDCINNRNPEGRLVLRAAVTNCVRVFKGARANPVADVSAWDATVSAWDAAVSEWDATVFAWDATVSASDATVSACGTQPFRVGRAVPKGDAPFLK